MPHWKTLALIGALVVAGWVLTMFLLSATAKKPGNLGVTDGRLAACPPTANCVSSQGTGGHAIEPLPFEGDPDAAWEKLKGVISARPRTAVVTETENYLHAEATSLIFRFVDDVEFLLDRTRR